MYSTCKAAKVYPTLHATAYNNEAMIKVDFYMRLYNNLKVYYELLQCQACSKLAKKDKMSHDQRLSSYQFRIQTVIQVLSGVLTMLQGKTNTGI